MTRRDLREVLTLEVERWSRKTFEEIAQIDFSQPILSRMKEGDFEYSLEVELLSQGSDYIKLGVSVWETGLSFYLPCCRAIIFDRGPTKLE